MAALEPEASEPCAATETAPASLAEAEAEAEAEAAAEAAAESIPSHPCPVSSLAVAATTANEPASRCAHWRLQRRLPLAEHFASRARRRSTILVPFRLSPRTRSGAAPRKP